MRTIYEPVHGPIPLTPLMEDLLEQPEVQRLAWVSQLGLTKLVFPGTNHCRMEHSLGTSFMAGRIAQVLGLSRHETNLVQAAGLLHDVGHTPFSHNLERLLPRDHMDYTFDIITGRDKPIPFGGRIPDILRSHGLDPREVGGLVCKRFKGKPYLQQLIFGGIDADQIDYLCRDAHYSGVGYGALNIDRLLATMVLVEDRICVLEKGLPAVEDMLVARDHMFGSVYLHHTGRIAELMLLRAAQSAVTGLPDFSTYTDAQLLERLREQNPYAKDMVERLLYRRLFKRAFILSQTEAGQEDRVALAALSRSGVEAIEAEIAEEAEIEPGYVIVDLPGVSALFTEPRFKDPGIYIVTKEGRVRPMAEVSAIAKALSERAAARSLFAVYGRAEDCEAIASATRKLLARARGDLPLL